MSMEDLRYELKNIFSYRSLVILTLGHPLRGDDAVGSFIGDQIELPNTAKFRIPVYNAETVPSNFMGKIIQDKPEIILIIDAVDMKTSPGTMVLYTEDAELHLQSLSTHYQDIKTLMKYFELQNNYRPEIIFLGIQIKQIDFNQPISPEIESKAMTVINLINGILEEIIKEQNE